MANGYIFGSQLNESGKSEGHFLQVGRVKSIVLGPYKGDTKQRDPDYGSPADIGKIKYELLYSPLGTSKSQEVSEPAWPIFNFIKQFPVVNEIVLILYGPGEGLNDKASNQQFFYFPPYQLWNHANHSAFPNMAEYSKYLKQFVNEAGYPGSKTKGSSLPLGYTFQENQSVKNLQPFEGDIILQARFGQSIRFGSTVPVMKKNNTWSNSGNNGDPITIIVNGQGQSKTLTKFDPIVEDINKDKSSIYLTAGQEINLQDLSLFPLDSFKVYINIINNAVELVKPPISDEILSAQFQDENNINNV
jgi:hypothetical protein